MTDQTQDQGFNKDLSREILKLDLALSHCGRVNLREATIADLQLAFEAKAITAAELTRAYIKRIQELDPYLHSVLEVNPDAEAIAHELDQERAQGKVRGPLHGIPILVKDNIGTLDKMETTAGSLALLGIKPKKEATVVVRLREAGAVILGKADLSEWANFRGVKIPNGWSGRGSYTLNPYVLSAEAWGSSTGSAVAVASNLCVASLGTDTGGSITCPSSLGGIVGLRPTFGAVPLDGLIPVSFTQDTIGPMTRTIQDAVIVYEAISKTKFKTKLFDIMNPDLEDTLKQSFRVGVWKQYCKGLSEEQSRDLENLDVMKQADLKVTDNWRQCFKGLSKHQMREFEENLDAMKRAGLEIIDNVSVPSELLDKVEVGLEWPVFHYEFKHGLNEYLATQVTHPPNSKQKIHCLADVMRFNMENPGAGTNVIFDQAQMEESEATPGIQDPKYIELRKMTIDTSRATLDHMFKKYNLDTIIAPLVTYDKAIRCPCMAGYPVLNVPGGIGDNGAPWGLTFIGQPHSEEKLFQIGYLFESVLNRRRTCLFKP